MKSTHWFPHPLLYTYPCALSLYPQQRTCHLYPSPPDPQAPWLPLQRVTVLVWPLLGEQQVDRRTERGRLAAKEDQIEFFICLFTWGENHREHSGGQKGEKKKRSAVGRCSIWQICRRVLRRWSAFSPGGGKEEFEWDTDSQKDRQW